MRCPFCKEDSDKVVDTRSVEEGKATRRRRECLNCGKRFTTYERLEASPLKVIKKSGERELFNRNKIRSGIEKACENLRVSTDTIDNAAASIESEIFSQYDREVPSELIGELVMRELAGIDKVAYVRFASVYREFQEVGEFYHVLREIDNAAGRTPSDSPAADSALQKETDTQKT